MSEELLCLKTAHSTFVLQVLVSSLAELENTWISSGSDLGGEVEWTRTGCGHMVGQAVTCGILELYFSLRLSPATVAS